MEIFACGDHLTFIDHGPFDATQHMSQSGGQYNPKPQAWYSFYLPRRDERLSDHCPVRSRNVDL